MSATTSLDARRMELRGIVRIAGEVVAQHWPMRNFVHHNPLHSLEYLPFEEAVGLGRKFLGGRGYLSGDTYRGYLRSGRIRPERLDAALRRVARDEAVMVGDCRIAHGDALRGCLTHGLYENAATAVADEALERELIERLARVMVSPQVAERIAATVAEDSEALGRFQTLSGWCDGVAGTDIVGQVNAEMIRWCEAFLDEGHATWPMPGREKGFYAAWRALAIHQWAPCGISGSRGKIAALPALPEDAALESLELLGVPSALRQDYLALQLTTLPGWAGFIKWRAEQRDYPWQVAHPISLVEFLAVRLWYIRELVGRVCGAELGIGGTFGAALDFMRDRSAEYFLRKELAGDRLPPWHAEEARRLAGVPGSNWSALADRLQRDDGPLRDRDYLAAAARRLIGLAAALDLVPSVLLAGDPRNLATLLDWLDAFPERAHGPVWLEAFEASYQEHLLEMLDRSAAAAREAAARQARQVRPQAQALFCIDVRSEPFRRHLEAAADIETFGFAGFFAAVVRFLAWGREHPTEQYPVVLRARNEVREVPRGHLEHVVPKQRSGARLVKAGHTLLHDLKQNVVTPYVMVESLGWFYGLPLVGRTFWPIRFRRLIAWLGDLLVPPLATRLTVDKLPPADVEDMLAAEQRAAVWRAVRERVGRRTARIDPGFVEALRLHAMSGHETLPASLTAAGAATGLDEGALGDLVGMLRARDRVEPRAASREKERVTRTGYTLEEQAVTVETALRMMGLTRDFARLILVCAHGSTSLNNPFESALDCGACGGNEGKPNARLLAAMANNPRVRELLAAAGIAIPADAHFIAGQYDTTTDRVELFDLEDAPHTHRGDLARLVEDLAEAGRLTSLERLARLPDADPPETPEEAAARVQVRSADWSQVRPEWGLSGNAALVVAPRALTRGLNLAGRVFLHSYDHREDPSGRLLEVILTGPQLVAQWINMEHYFSTVDNEIHGSGSKVYHNVVGRFGVMSGPWSDLRLGLARQTVMSGDRPYHEPMRLLTVVAAPRARIVELIDRHELLQRYYRNQWVHLVAIDPEDGEIHRYRPSGTWTRVHFGGKESDK
ncbi:MAG: DUF2309 domain-containing protein [Candidatus Sericytochromatia bacterium]|nr:DUF2309 domain-containing protein [Candidatus Tanganyikabacteria bacterium]